jgi:hypothetical protein
MPPSKRAELMAAIKKVRIALDPGTKAVDQWGQDPMPISLRLSDRTD